MSERSSVVSTKNGPSIARGRTTHTAWDCAARGRLAAPANAAAPAIITSALRRVTGGCAIGRPRLSFSDGLESPETRREDGGRRARARRAARRAQMKSFGTFDYIIIGAGTAGCALANRLSADPRTSVLLLEAGGKDDWIWIHIP